MGGNYQTFKNVPKTESEFHTLLQIDLYTPLNIEIEHLWTTLFKANNMNTPLYLATLPSPGSCSCGVVGGLLTENIALSKHSGAILFFLSYKIFDPKK